MIERPLEVDLWKEADSILGIDEAGRGPICGPVVVAGVIFPKGYANSLLDDSKKLSEKKREALFKTIVSDSLFFEVMMVSEDIIDEKNIYQATKWAMESIARKANASLTLTDAMPLSAQINHQAIIKGDSKSISIAAASILAKVCRDHYMYKLDALYPQYGLRKHKGYPTKAHLEAIDRYGIQKFYRKSYKPVQKIMERQEQMTLF